MPNWCMNHLTVAHKDHNMLEKFCAAYNNGSLCEYFIPQPPHINNENCFAADGWYKWRVDNWGTKWDFGKEEYDDPAVISDLEPLGDDVKEGVVLSFNTAWSPPVPLYDKLVELGYHVRASYFEPGCAFCGIYYDGHDNYAEYQHHDMIPVAIWNEYNLDEFFSDEMMGETDVQG